MKQKFFLLAGLMGALQLSGQAEGQSLSSNQSSDPERILEGLNESAPELDLGEKEEKAHTERVRRLYELEKQAPVIDESAGADAAGDTVPETSGEDLTLERLIEAIEELQMEIRELRAALSKAPVEKENLRTPGVPGEKRPF